MYTSYRAPTRNNVRLQTRTKYEIDIVWNVYLIKSHSFPILSIRFYEPKKISYKSLARILNFDQNRKIRHDNVSM